MPDRICAPVLLVVIAVLLLCSCGGGGGGGPAQNRPPSAALTASPDTGTAPLEVTFNASGSSDPDGQIVRYEWDFGSAGGSLTTTTPTVTVPLSRPFGMGPTLVTVSVQVTDDGGLSDSAQTSVTVDEPFVTSSQVIPGPDLGSPNALGVFGGNPIVAYIDRGDLNNAFVMRATDASGSSWGDRESLGIFGAGPVAIGEAAGLPVAAVVNDPFGITFFRPDDISGDHWEAFELEGVNGSFHVNDELLLLNAAGNPAIAFIRRDDPQTSTVIFKRAFDAEGTDWADAGVAADFGEIEHMTSLQFGALIGVFYEEADSREMRFVLTANAEGSFFEDPETVSTDAGDVDFLDAAIVDGNPAVAFRDGGELIYGRRSAAGVWTTTVAAPARDNGYSVLRLIELNGRPAIIVRGASDDSLLLVPGLDAAGSTFGVPLQFFSEIEAPFSAMSFGGRAVVLAEDPGEPELEYLVVGTD